MQTGSQNMGRKNVANCSVITTELKSYLSVEL